MNDPFFDKNGDTIVPHRQGAGFLETAKPLPGVSDDFDDTVPKILQTRLNRDIGRGLIEN